VNANQRTSYGRIETFCRLLRATLVPRLARQWSGRRGVTILLYHRPGRPAFADHVRALEKAYNLISLRRLVHALERGSFAELPPRPLVISFDDGHRSNIELLDVIRGLSAPPTIFLCSGIVGTDAPYWFDTVPDPEPLKRLPNEERLRALGTAASGNRTRMALDAREIEVLRPYVDFQSHTVTHPILTRCDDRKAFEELACSREQLERDHGLDVYALAYPNGDHSEREQAMARRAGYRCAVTVEPGANTVSADPFRLKRVPINDDRDGPSVVLVKASGIWGAVRARVRVRPRRARQAA
jgi:peptidoglycan/xylan/chitin deacetylase (PgdA/CDA1 family)